jgi:hypothetical protein
VLTVGEALVEVDFGELTPTDGPQWGGLLHDVPRELAAAMCQGADARLLFDDGQERTVHPAALPRMDAYQRALVPFLGEGPLPAEDAADELRGG